MSSESLRARLEAAEKQIAEFKIERDTSSAEAEALTAGMKEVALFRAANYQGLLGSYAGFGFTDLRLALDVIEAAKEWRESDFDYARTKDTMARWARAKDRLHDALDAFEASS